MTQAILPTRLWGGSAEEKARRDELRVPMIDGNGRAFEDKWILSGTRLGDGSTRPQRRSNRLHPHLSRRAPVADTSVCPLRSDCLRVCRHRPGNGCSVRMQACGAQAAAAHVEPAVPAAAARVRAAAADRLPSEHRPMAGLLRFLHACRDRDGARRRRRLPAAAAATRRARRGVGARHDAPAA